MYTYTCHILMPKCIYIFLTNNSFGESINCQVFLYSFCKNYPNIAHDSCRQLFLLYFFTCSVSQQHHYRLISMHFPEVHFFLHSASSNLIEITDISTEIHIVILLCSEKKTF